MAEHLSFLGRVRNTLRRHYRTSRMVNREACREIQRERAGEGILVRENRFHILEAVEWIKRAQDSSTDDGISWGYSVGWNSDSGPRGWQPSYPETTGYIIPTFFDCAQYLGDPELRERAVRMANWETDVQMADGAVMGGVINRPQTPAIFNTGQVILGWLRTHEESGDQRHLESARQAGEFLISNQIDSGNWWKANSQFADPLATIYNTRVAWSLILLGLAMDRPDFVQGGRKNIDYALDRQEENGWFRENCLDNPNAPLLHTICYAAEGVLGSGEALSDMEYIARARLTVDHLLPRIPEDGQIPGRLDNQWRGPVSWSCLTGCAQLAALLLRFHKLTGEDPYREKAKTLLAFLKRTQNCVADNPGLRGGIKGSYPFDGMYGRFQLLNWAVKFYLDALLLDEAAGA